MKSSFDVARVAELARVALTDGEAELLQKQVAATLTFAAMLDELDLSGVAPTVYGRQGTGVLRDDVEIATVDRERLLADAPARYESEYRLPRIIEDA